jgi:phosphoribosylaminoimidazole (AIR) synthetase
VAWSGCKIGEAMLVGGTTSIVIEILALGRVDIGGIIVLLSINVTGDQRLLQVYIE